MADIIATVTVEAQTLLRRRDRRFFRLISISRQAGAGGLLSRRALKRGCGGRYVSLARRYRCAKRAEPDFRARAASRNI